MLTLPPATTPPAVPGTPGAPARDGEARDEPARASAAAPSGSAVAHEGAAASHEGAAASADRLRELHLLWARVRSAPWRSLLLMPADAGVSGMGVAEGLLQAARVFSPLEPLQLLDARGLQLEDVAVLGGRLAAQLAAGQRVLLVTDSPLQNAATLALAHQADAGLLCARLGVDLRDARQTLALCGRERFLGSVIVPG